MAKNWIPPISPLIGSSVSNFFRALKSRKVNSAYYLKVFLSAIISGITSLFMPWERIREKKTKTLTTAPIFIIGHWRSGTTHLHNLLCQDPNAGYITTYQSLFPNNLHSKILFKTILKMVIPGKRPSDNVKLDVDFPQEDEFALENMFAPSFYNFFYFPDHYSQLFDATVLFKNKDEEYIKQWKKAYMELITKGENNTNAIHMILKNPVNTGRVDSILEMYTDARFIHIYRNPVIVYLSTKKFFLSLIPELQLQLSSEEQIIDLIFDLYSRLMNTYFEKRSQIPPSQLIELDFESFENDSLNQLKNIYSSLKIPNWEQSLPYFEKYIDHLSDYKKNTYKISQKELNRITSEWDFAFEKLDYKIPDHLEIIE